MKVTLIIPTRERADTLYQTLLTCVEQKYDDFEIIVSDNCSADNTKEVVKSIKDKRIKYIKTQSRISMSSNFEYALSHVEQGIVGFIGDDDGLMENAILKVVDFFNLTKIKALTSVYANYRWPSSPDSIKNTAVLNFLREGDQIRDSKFYIQKSLKGTGSFYIHDLPSLYYGFADSSLAKRIDGKFFHSITPDAYSAFAIAAQVKNYGYLAEPLFIVGAAGKSNGVSAFAKDANKSEAILFSNENDINFHAKLIYCRSISVSLYESFLQAADIYDSLYAQSDFSLLDMFHCMGKEINESNKEGFIDIAYQIGHLNRMTKKQVTRALSGKRMPLLDYLILKEKLSHYKKFNINYQVSLQNMLTLHYSNLQEKGILDVYAASKFFKTELQEHAKQNTNS